MSFWCIFSGFSGFLVGFWCIFSGFSGFLVGFCSLEILPSEKLASDLIVGFRCISFCFLKKASGGRLMDFWR